MRLRYFAWVRERAGIGEEEVELPPEVETVGDVIDWLRGRGAEFEYAFENAETIRAAVDLFHVEHSTSVAGAAEIAFFPPVTGG